LAKRGADPRDRGETINRWKGEERGERERKDAHRGRVRKRIAIPRLLRQGIYATTKREEEKRKKHR